MAKQRHSNIGYQLKKELRAMYCPGESKKAYIDETNRQGAAYKKELIEQGCSKQEAHRLSQDICTYREKIFSESTLQSYQKSVQVFEQFCKEQLGTKRISMLEAALHVQEFADWCSAKGYTAQTIHLRLSAVCKAMRLKLCDYEKPIRHAADTTRGTQTAKNDAYNEKRAEKALSVNRLIGVRRQELGKIKLSDISFLAPDWAEVYTVGKGGKHNTNLLFTVADVAKLKAYVDEAAAKGQTYLLTKEELQNDADLHSARAQRAKDVYTYVCADMKAHPERRDYYKDTIRRIFDRNGKRLTEDLDIPYRCRGQNRQKLLEMDKDATYDRVAVMFVSCTVTNHFRSNVTVTHYLSK